MPDFAANVSTDGASLLVTLSGECDIAVHAELASVLLDAVNRSPAVVVDLAALTFLDSSGLHELVSAYQAAREHNGHLTVRNAAGVVATVLDMTGVAKLLSPPDDQDSAGGSIR